MENVILNHKHGVITIPGDIYTYAKSNGYYFTVNTAKRSYGYDKRVMIVKKVRCVITERYQLGRFILGNKPSVHVDHIDGNALNNDRGNLRYATHSQNNANRKKSEGKRFKHKGVSMKKNCGRYYAACRKEGFRLTAGPFKSEHAAGAYYNKLAAFLHGDYAKLNDLNNEVSIKEDS